MVSQWHKYYGYFEDDPRDKSWLFPPNVQSQLKSTPEHATPEKKHENPEKKRMETPEKQVMAAFTTPLKGATRLCIDESGVSDAKRQRQKQ